MDGMGSHLLAGRVPLAARLLRHPVDRAALLLQLRPDPENAGDPGRAEAGGLKYIAPEALFWFRWAALFTVLMGAIVAYTRGYLRSRR